MDSPYRRSKSYFEVLGIELEIEDLAASLISESAEKNNRAGARALRTIFGKIINPLEFDPWKHKGIEELPEGGHRLTITSEMVRRVTGNGGQS